jgi:hypothetical protein
MAPPTIRPMKIWVVREGRYQGRRGEVAFEEAVIGGEEDRINRIDAIEGSAGFVKSGERTRRAFPSATWERGTKAEIILAF